ncbi:hypothetical protein BOX15_Mlig001748g3, partial [Macrostomum lignano]
DPQHLEQKQQDPQHLEQKQQGPEHLEQKQQGPEHLEQKQQGPEHLEQKQQGPEHLERKQQDPQHLEQKQQHRIKPKAGQLIRELAHAVDCFDPLAIDSGNYHDELSKIDLLLKKVCVAVPNARHLLTSAPQFSSAVSMSF